MYTIMFHRRNLCIFLKRSITDRKNAMNVLLKTDFIDGRKNAIQILLEAKLEQAGI